MVPINRVPLISCACAIVLFSWGESSAGPTAAVRGSPADRRRSAANQPENADAQQIDWPENAAARAVGIVCSDCLVSFGPRGSLGLQLSGIVCSFCLSILALKEGTLGLELRGIVYLFSSVNFEPRRTLGFQLSGIVC